MSMKISLGRIYGQVNDDSVIPFESNLASVDANGWTTVAAGGSRIAISVAVVQNNIEHILSH